ACRSRRRNRSSAAGDRSAPVRIFSELRPSRAIPAPLPRYSSLEPPSLAAQIYRLRQKYRGVLLATGVMHQSSSAHFERWTECLNVHRLSRRRVLGVLRTEGIGPRGGRRCAGRRARFENRNFCPADGAEDRQTCPLWPG